MTWQILRKEMKVFTISLAYAEYNLIDLNERIEIFPFDLCGPRPVLKGHAIKRVSWPWESLANPDHAKI